MKRFLILLFMVAFISTGCVNRGSSSAQPSATRLPPPAATVSSPTATLSAPTPSIVVPCPITTPNGNTPPGEQAAPDYLGNGALWTGLWSNGTVLIAPRNIQDDSSLAMKFFWWRGVRGALTIEGKRLDTPAPPLRSHIPEGYGDIGFQSTAIIFPTEGCWQVTGKVGDALLTFVTRVLKVDKLPWE